jgi:hypothetical protein
MHSLFNNNNNNNNNTPLLQKKSCGQKISKTMKKLICTPVRARALACAKKRWKILASINQSIAHSEKKEKKKKPSRMI